MRGPGRAGGAAIDSMVLNNDLAPTFAAIAGVEPPSFVDGRSFLQLLAKPETPWRRSFLIERRQMETHESPATRSSTASAPRPHLCRVRTGERELYDLAADPFELSNLVRTADPALSRQSPQRLAELKNCAANNCRMLEDLPVEPKAIPVAESDVHGKG